MTPSSPRTAEQIIDAMARRSGVVTPVPAYFPLGTSFAAGCVREAYLDAIGVLRELAAQQAGDAGASKALRLAIQKLEEGIE